MSDSLISLLTLLRKKRQELRTHRLQEPEGHEVNWQVWYDHYRTLATDLSVLKEEFLKASVKEVFSCN
jgi:hypothetical protein